MPVPLRNRLLRLPSAGPLLPTGRTPDERLGPRAARQAIDHHQHIPRYDQAVAIRIGKHGRRIRACGVARVQRLMISSGSIVEIKPSPFTSKGVR